MSWCVLERTVLGELVTAVPVITTLVLLGNSFRTSWDRLKYAGSNLLWICYLSTWLATILALARLLVEVFTSSLLVWEILATVQGFGSIWVQACVLALILHSHMGWSLQVVQRSLGLAVLVAGVDSTVRCLLMFLARVPLYVMRPCAQPNDYPAEPPTLPSAPSAPGPPDAKLLYSMLHHSLPSTTHLPSVTVHTDHSPVAQGHLSLAWGSWPWMAAVGYSSMQAPTGGPCLQHRWASWSFWLVHCVVFAAVYVVLYLSPATPLRDLLPAKRTLRRYLGVLACVYGTGAVGALLAGLGLTVGGCVSAGAQWALNVGLGPLLWVTFLSGPLSSSSGADGLDEDLLMYREMRDAGVLDDDAYEGPGW